MQKRLAIIPARGGSKRIKNKNIKYFCGKPMIAYMLDTARKSSLFNTIHVSTENIEIRNKVNELGFEIDFMRPLDLADDYTPIMPVLRFVVESYAKQGVFFDQVWLLMACAPLIEVEDLVAAEKMFINFNQMFFYTYLNSPLVLQNNGTNYEFVNAVNGNTQSNATAMNDTKTVLNNTLGGLPLDIFSIFKNSAKNSIFVFNASLLSSKVILQCY